MVFIVSYINPIPIVTWSIITSKNELEIRLRHFSKSNFSSIA